MTQRMPTLNKPKVKKGVKKGAKKIKKKSRDPIEEYNLNGSMPSTIKTIQ